MNEGTEGQDPNEPDHEADPSIGHHHINPQLLKEIMRAVSEALPIDNLFVVLAPNPARFVLTNQEEDGSLRVIGAIPFEFMLEVSMGLTRAVQQAVVGNMPALTHTDGPMPEPTQVGPFKVI